jgi:L-ascorbate metabolism protein UlaG (beta-lactamase superfamily)
MVEITYIGHSAFKIKGKNLSLVVDPYGPKIGYKFPKQTCEVVLTTHDHFDHANLAGVSGQRLHIDGPGEYEVGGVFITGIPTFHDKKNGEDRGINTIYLIDIDGFSILHLGDLGHALSQEAISKLTDIDILLIPVGGKYTLDAEAAAKVVSSVEPGIVVPMHYNTKDLTGVTELEGVEKFLDEMGTDDNVRKLTGLKLSSSSDVPEETEVIQLLPQH